MKFKINKKSIKAVIAVVVILCLCITVFFFLSRWENKANLNSGGAQYEDDSRINVDGKWYAPNDNIETVLVMGLDKYQSETEVESYNNAQQADFLMLFVFDNSQKEYSVLHIDRDTMCNIPVLGVRGEDAGTIYGQLALAHTYGSGKNDSCRNTADAVSDFLYNQRINHYASFTLDAIAKINDLAGGVTLELTEDFSSQYPEMIKGNTVKLDGDMALTYVRSRQGLDDSSNIARMERQRDYLASLQDAVSQKAKSDDNFYVDVLKEISAYTVTDYTSSQLSNLFEKVESYKNNGFITIEGSSVKGEKYMEFYADEDSLKSLVADLFYIQVNE